MALKAIANKNMTIQVKSPVSGEVTVKSQPSTNVKADGSGVYRGPLKFSVSTIKSIDCGTQTPGELPEGVINPSAKETKVDNKAVIRVGDSQDFKVTAVNPGPSICTINFTVEIVKAGQSDVLGS